MIKFRRQFCEARFAQEIVPCSYSCPSGRIFLFPIPIPSNDLALENLKLLLITRPLSSVYNVVGIFLKPGMGSNHFLTLVVACSFFENFEGLKTINS